MNSWQIIYTVFSIVMMMFNSCVPYTEDLQNDKTIYDPVYVKLNGIEHTGDTYDYHLPMREIGHYHFVYSRPIFSPDGVKKILKIAIDNYSFCPLELNRKYNIKPKSTTLTIHWDPYEEGDESLLYEYCYAIDGWVKFTSVETTEYSDCCKVYGNFEIRFEDESGEIIEATEGNFGPLEVWAFDGLYTVYYEE